MTTERVMLDALWARLTQTVNGGSPRHVMAEQVRYDPTWGYAIADAISVDTWRDSGRGQCLHGYEVKVSRSDYLRELRNPQKHETWAQHCRYWWVVVPDKQILGDLDSVPHGWGVLELSGRRWLRQIRPAVLRPEPARLPVGTTASLMRATMQTARHHALTPAERLMLGRVDPPQLSETP